jgi:hypothetical protein
MAQGRLKTTLIKRKPNKPPVSVSSERPAFSTTYSRSIVSISPGGRPASAGRSGALGMINDGQGASLSGADRSRLKH